MAVTDEKIIESETDKDSNTIENILPSAETDEVYSLQLRQIEIDHKKRLFTYGKWVLICGGVIIFVFILIFFFGVCSYISHSSEIHSLKIIPTQQISSTASSVISIEPIEWKESPKDWHFLLLLGELLIAIVFLFSILAKSAFRTKDDNQNEKVNETVINSAIKVIFDYFNNLRH